MAIEHINSRNYEAIIKKSDKPVLIDFWAPWCGPCKMLGPIFEELSNDYGDKAVFAKLDTDTEPEIAEKFEIQGIPCMILLVNGEEKGRIVGFLPKDALKKKINSLLD